MEDRNVKVPMVGDVWRWSAPSGICYKITRIEQTGAIYARRNDAGPTERGKQVAADAVDLNKHWTFVRRAEPTSPAKPESSEPAQVVPMVGDVWKGRGFGSEWTIGRIDLDGTVYASHQDGKELPYPVAISANVASLSDWADLVSRRQEPEPVPTAPTCEAPGWLGRSHAVDATDYGVCRVCGSSESDRARERRRAFDADEQRVRVVFVAAPEGEHRENYWRALYKPHEDRVAGSLVARAPTRELAIEALWMRLEAQRRGSRGE